MLERIFFYKLGGNIDDILQWKNLIFIYQETFFWGGGGLNQNLDRLQHFGRKLKAGQQGAQITEPYVVYRQYHEFYSLQSALVQYHGMFEDAKVFLFEILFCYRLHFICFFFKYGTIFFQLPARSKLFRGKGLDVLQSKLEPFEQFLGKHCFLCCLIMCIRVDWSVAFGF
jgi:hypothetical protein